jgi:hypothetical protein
MNGAMKRNLVPIARERDICERGTCDRTAVEVVTDVADVGVNNASLHLEDKRLWLIKGWIDVLVRPPHLSI